MTLLLLLAGAIWRVWGHGSVVPQDGSWDVWLWAVILAAVAVDVRACYWFFGPHQKWPDEPR